MSGRALTLVHDPAPTRRDRIPGALAPAFADRGLELDVASCVDPAETAPDGRNHDLLIVLGSHESARDDQVPWLAREIALVTAALRRGQPVLGVCFGAQLVARCLGGSVHPSRRPERGVVGVESDDPDLVPAGPWMQLHSDTFTVPVGGVEIARNDSGTQAFSIGNVLGVQFHPEITTDSFASWVERWSEEGVPGTDTPRVDDLRRQIARNEQHSVEACHRLVTTFCARHLAS